MEQRFEQLSVVRTRAERFGAIVLTRDPPALVSVDRALAESLGVDGGPLWDGPAPSLAESELTAPTEAHVAVTERCAAGCAHCYVGATPDGEVAELADLARRFSDLASVGVFRVALGGGEAITHPRLADVVAAALRAGLEPTLTTSGLGLTPARAEALRGVAQVNVSFDGHTAVSAEVRGYDAATPALRAMELLRAYGIPFGVNVVLTRASLPALEATVEAAAAMGAVEAQLLRRKPAGRGELQHLAERLRPEDVVGFADRLARLVRASIVPIRIDCSMVPYLAGADLPVDALLQFGVAGCEGGRSLVAIDVRGHGKPCSFVGSIAPTGTHVASQPPSSLAWFRAHHASLPEPCRSCSLAPACRGGCRVVAAALTGDPHAPDPECPRVIAHTR